MTEAVIPKGEEALQNEIANLERQLVDVRKQQKEEADRKRRRTPQKHRFTVLPADKRHLDERIYDDSCKFYEIAGEVVNKEECLAAGWSQTQFFEGGMVYVFNTLSGKIVCGTGGGSIHIGGGWKNDDKEDARATFAQVSQFIVEHPEGGDITHIVEPHRRRRLLD